MEWTVAFDSGANLRNIDTPNNIHFGIAPLKIVIGDNSVSDDGGTSLEEMQIILDGEKKKTGSACPSVEDWRVLMEKGDAVIAITISKEVSGSFQSALIAKDMILESHPDKKIFVLNSMSGSGSMSFLVRKAVKLIKEGKDFKEVCCELETASKRSKTFFMIQNVDNLITNGRINPIVGRAIKTLKLCLLATVSEKGDLEVVSKIRNFEKAMDGCIDELAKRGYECKKFIISHCLNPKGAEEFKNKLLKKYPDAEIEVMETGLLCGYYVEKGGIIASVEA